jgi:N-acetylglutamate synthase-like GNAT family acetyltransferase
MTYSLRPATQADFPAIRALIRAVQINPIGLDWRRFIVAVTPQEAIIGCGQIKPHRDGSRELASIAVVPEWRGRGVARAMIERLVEVSGGAAFAEAEAVEPLYLTCRASLGSFYERFGFRIIQPDEMPPYFRRISRLARMAGFVMREELLVMKRDA